MLRDGSARMPSDTLKSRCGLMHDIIRFDGVHPGAQKEIPRKPQWCNPPACRLILMNLRYFLTQDKTAAYELLLSERERHSAAVEKARQEAEAAVAEGERLRSQLRQAAATAARHKLSPEQVRLLVLCGEVARQGS